MPVSIHDSPKKGSRISGGRPNIFWWRGLGVVIGLVQTRKPDSSS
jgi:hypothetical protein